MSRNKKFILNAIIVLLVIGLLGGGIYFLTRPEEEPNLGEIMTDDDEVKIFSYDTSELTGVHVRNKYGEYSLARTASSWTIEGFDGISLNSTMLDTLVNTFSSVTSPSRIEEAPADLSVYGLAEPQAELGLTLADGGKTFYIGDETPDGAGYYFNTDTSTDVYTMESYMVDVINLTAKDYADINVDFTADDITAVSVTSQDGTVLSVEKQENGEKDAYGLLSYWDITAPKKQSASNSDVATYLTSPLADLINGASAIMVDSNENIAKTGLNAPQYTVTFTAASSTITYAISPSDGEYRYVKDSDSGYIFRVDDADCDFAALEAYDITEKYLALVEIGLVSGVTITDGDRATELTIVDGSGENASFYADGKEVDADTFRTFYSHIVALDVSGEAENPSYENVVGSIEYRLTTGESIKLEFVPYDDRNYAVFVNGDGLYTALKKNIDKVFDEVSETF